MALSAGAKLGPYEIQSPQGAGGMGEVYRARDTRLDRTVAIKILPSHLSADPEARQRFDREARAISSLNHPNICTLYDVGHQEGTDYLVMEFLEGETLADRLSRGPLPSQQVLKHGVEICDGLEKAHRSGVMHRDLKPGNIMLTKTGAKLMDFGLAKAMSPSSPPSSGLTATLASPVGSHPLTTQGTVVGTFQYMSPEQVEGKEADARSDIFALGTVLYEMVTGKKAFQGKSHLSVVSAILEREPEAMATVQPLAPRELEQVVKGCLAKDPDDRWQSAHDVARQLKWISESGSHQGMAAYPGAGKTRRTRGLAALAVAGWALLALALLVGGWLWHRPEPASTVIAEIRGPEGYAVVGVLGGNRVAISPDGKAVVFAAISQGKRSLWIRRLDSTSSQSLSGTEGAIFPFWSPDSRFIGFFADKKLKKIEAVGGIAQTICDASDGRGAAWNREGVIVFAPDIRGPIYRVPDGGGTPTPVTSLDSGDTNTSHREPEFLPDGRHFLFVSSPTNAIMVGSLNSIEKPKLVVENGSNAFFNNGYLLYAREGNLLAQRFDLKGLQAAGNPTAVAAHIDYAPLRATGNFSVSENGVLVYREAFVPQVQLSWFDNAGKPLGPLGEPGNFRTARVSPDGRTVLVPKFDPQTTKEDLWLMDAVRATLSRFTFEPHDLYTGVWSPDSKEIVLSAANAALIRRPANGSGHPEELLPTSDIYRVPSDWSRDGRYLIMMVQNLRTGNDIVMLPLQGEHKTVPVLQTEFNEEAGKLSPDGRLLAYFSNASGRAELYVTEFPGPGGRWQISSEGVTTLYVQPAWRQDGREIYYVDAAGKLVAVNLGNGNEIKPGSPRTILNLPRAIASFDMTSDGRFLVLSPVPQDTSPAITVVVNWDGELKK
jgi:eukaryotic-like serine/threonine-protein kinase